MRHSVLRATSDNEDGDNNDNNERLFHSQPLDSSSYQSRHLKDVRDMFLDFLNIPIQPFVAAPRATSSVTSRTPRLFDLHLHPHLQLRKIVVVKDLPARIAEVCRKKFISKFLLHLPASGTFPFDDAGERRRALASQGGGLVNESALGFSYQIRFGAPLTTLSSTIIFETNTWASVFRYALSVKDPVRSDINFAKPDGFLCVTDENSSESLSLPKEDMDNIALILKHNLNRMALWEFKNLKAGSKADMDKFVALEGDFAWSTCRPGQKGNNCHNNHRHDINGQITVTGRKIGFDAKDSLSLVNGGLSGTNRPDAKGGVDVDNPAPRQDSTLTQMETDKEVGPSTATVSIQTVSTLQKMHNTAVPKGVAAKKAAITSRPTSRSSHLEQVESLKTSKRGLERITPTKPRDMAQQLWAEGVKYDATYLVLNSGNYEVICMRHRETQTLYISPVFEVVDRSYKTTQIGLHILAYYDALDRARQLEALEAPDNQTPIPRFYNLKLHVEAYHPVYQNTGARVINHDDSEDNIYKGLLEQLETKHKFHVKMSTKDKSYSTCVLERSQSETESSSQSSSSFDFSLSDKSSSDSSMSDIESSFDSSLADASWSLTVGKKITDRVYLVTADDHQNHSFSNKLVIKLAQNGREYSELDYEYQCHQRFSSQAFGIKTFGILNFDSKKRLTRGLLMEWSGDSLQAILEKPKLRKQYNPQCIHAKNALQLLHESGSLHGDLKEAHLLLTEGGDVSFISYKKDPFGEFAKRTARHHEEELVEGFYELQDLL